MYSKIKRIIKKFIPYSILILYRQRQKLNKLKRRKILSFEVHIADHCNLNCKGCDHFSPIADEKYLDIDIFNRDCKRIATLTKNKVHLIKLLGGEPLLHPQLIDFLDITRKYFPNSHIIILTNGILLLKQSNEFWETCKKNNISIHISKYPIKIDHRAIELLAKTHDIVLEYAGGQVKEMWRIPFDINGTQDIKFNVKECFRFNKCIFLQDGKLYTCPMIPCIKHFNKYFNQNLEVTEDDYIDIYKARSIDEILTFLCKPVPFCRYCNFKEAVTGGITWSISKKDISEWV
jgi:MoaA/NifB/PqqE/SkfB family radical SAM enzyme